MEANPCLPLSTPTIEVIHASQIPNTRCRYGNSDLLFRVGYTTSITTNATNETDSTTSVISKDATDSINAYCQIKQLQLRCQTLRSSMGLRPRLSAAAASRLYWNPRAGARDPLFENRWAGTNREHHLHDALDRSGSDRRSRAKTCAGGTPALPGGHPLMTALLPRKGGVIGARSGARALHGPWWIC